MRSRMELGCALFLVLVGLMAAPNISGAQAPGPIGTPPAPIDNEPPVIQYDLSGPRLGATFDARGSTRSQFGWHFEHQAGPNIRGPWFIVETVLLVGGVENDQFIPNGTMIFGVRLPNSLEFGVGPSLTLGGYDGFFRTGVVVAAGHSFRAGGIRIPLHAAVSLTKDGQEQYSIVTGWALKNRVWR
jgi:hypothetical protein